MRRFSALCLLLAGFATPICAQQAVTYSSFLTGLSVPVEVVNAGDATNRLFVVQQNGIVRVYDPAAGGLQTTPFLNISGIVLNNGEQGLLSMAFHPQFETNGYFFVYYNNTSGAITVARYQASGRSNVADGNSGVVLLTIAKRFSNHNGGHLQFGADGNLYFGTGDGGSGNDPDNNGQDSTTLLGKMLRINVDNFSTFPYYTVPTTNPFYNTPNFDNRIWARGLRNPFRWSFDRLTGDMWIGDVGQDAKEEINFTPGSSTGGENYGWRCYEGNLPTPGIAQPCGVVNYKAPVFDYDNPINGAASVVGGYVYRGAEYPFFQGWYSAADVYSGSLYLLRSNGSGGFVVRTVTGLPNSIVGFGEAEDGTLYAVKQNTGVVFKVVPNATVLPVTLLRFTGRHTPAGNELQWTVAAGANAKRFVLEYSSDGTAFAPLTEAAGGSTEYAYLHQAPTGPTAFYRLQTVAADGSRTYSAVVRINGRGGKLQVYPTLLRNGLLTVISEAPLRKIQIMDAAGHAVYEKALQGLSGQMQLQLPPLARGVYIVRLFGEGVESRRIVVE